MAFTHGFTNNEKNNKNMLISHYARVAYMDNSHIHKDINAVYSSKSGSISCGKDTTQYFYTFTTN